MRARALAPAFVLIASILAGPPAAGCSADKPPVEQEKSVARGDVKLAYWVLGAPGRSPPLVAINGGPGFDHSYLRSSPIWDKLSSKRPIVLYDQRGTGKSKPATGHALPEYIADLDAIRAAIGAEQIDLFGHSWGGYLAMAYAARHPERVRRLVLCDSIAPKFNDTAFLFKALFPDVTERQERIEGAAARGDEAAGKEMMRDLVSMLFVSPARRAEFMSKNQGLRLDLAINHAVEADVAARDLGPELGAIKAKTLIVSGRFDANIAPETAWKIHKAIPGSRVRFFEESGHFPFVEEPARFVEAMEEHLSP